VGLSSRNKNFVCKARASKCFGHTFAATPFHSFTISLFKMENFDQPLDVGMADIGPDRSGLSITPEIRQYWRETANWALFFAVLMFLIYGFIVLAMLLAGVAGGGMGMVGAVFVIGIYTLVFFLPAWYYYKFSSQSKQAMNTDDTALLDEAFTNLRRYYNYIGILTIVIISLYLLMILIFGAAILGR
jgi:hypothetical protein